MKLQGEALPREPGCKATTTPHPLPGHLLLPPTLTTSTTPTTQQRYRFPDDHVSTCQRFHTIKRGWLRHKARWAGQVASRQRPPSITPISMSRANKAPLVPPVPKQPAQQTPTNLKLTFQTLEAQAALYPSYCSRAVGTVSRATCEQLRPTSVRHNSPSTERTGHTRDTTHSPPPPTPPRQRTPPKLL